LCSKPNAAQLVEELMHNNDSVSVHFTERTWLKADDPERFEVEVTFRDEVRE